MRSRRPSGVEAQCVRRAGGDYQYQRDHTGAERERETEASRSRCSDNQRAGEYPSRAVTSVHLPVLPSIGEHQHQSDDGKRDEQQRGERGEMIRTTAPPMALRMATTVSQAR